VARLIPPQDFRDITYTSERVVAEALVNTLDDDWFVYHSYPWLTAEEKGPLQMGEADFVLYSPKWGLLVAEVKGGTVEFDQDTQIWFQSGRPMKESPFEQARRNLFALRDRILKTTSLGRLAHDLPCTRGYAVILPHSRTEGTLPPGGDESILLDAQSLENLGPQLLKALRRWAGNKDPRPLSSEQHKEMRKGLLSNFRVVPSLTAVLDTEAATLARLTQEQSEALEGLYDNSRVLVEGVAGSGKTLLAMNRAQAFAEEGKEVLVVCFNRKLAEHLQRRTLHEKITIRHFHGLVSEVCLKAFHQFEVPPNAGPEFWVEEVAQMLQDALEELPDYRFDAIIVDEGQDFHTDWFIVLEDAHRRSPGPIYVFFDRAQNLYSKDLRFPDTETKYRLGKNCRNTKKIAGACEKTIGETIKVAAFSPEGEPPEIVSYRDDQELSSLVVRELDRCLKQEKLSPSRVAVLTHVKPERSALGTGKIGNHTTTDDLDIWQSGKAVWFSTIKAFKGLEADVLLLVGVPEIDTRHFTKSDLYVASSRARLRLLVYSNAQEVRDLLS
jgi:hypothetical protein